MIFTPRLMLLYWCMIAVTRDLTAALVVGTTT